MAQKPLRQCSVGGCSAYTRAGRCDRHAREPKFTRSKASKEAQKLYTAAWAKTSKAFLAAHPLCAECERQGRTTAAYCTDHIKPHRGDYDTFWTRENWQPLCRECHQVKTLRGE